MTAEAQIFSLLSGNSAVAALVGGTGDDARIYPEAIPMAVPLPAIAYTNNRTPVTTVSGHVYGTENRISIACWAMTRTEADALADAVEVALLSIGQVWDARTANFDGEIGSYSATISLNMLT